MLVVSCVEGRGLVAMLQGTGQLPAQGIIQPQMLIMLRLREPEVGGVLGLTCTFQATGYQPGFGLTW